MTGNVMLTNQFFGHRLRSVVYYDENWHHAAACGTAPRRGLVYTHNLLREMLALEIPHEFVLIYRNPDLIGTYGDGDQVQEIAVQAPSALVWDQLAVPWLERKEKFDVIFNPKFTIPFLSRAKKVFVIHGSEWFVIPQAYLWYDRSYTHTLTSLIR